MKKRCCIVGCNQVDVVYNVDEIYRRTHFGCFSNYGFAVLKVIFDCAAAFNLKYDVGVAILLNFLINIMQHFSLWFNCIVARYYSVFM